MHTVTEYFHKPPATLATPLVRDTSPSAAFDFPLFPRIGYAPQPSLGVLDSAPLSGAGYYAVTIGNRSELTAAVPFEGVLFEASALSWRK